MTKEAYDRANRAKQVREWRKANPERDKQICQKYRDAHKLRLRAKAAIRHQLTKEIRTAQKRARRLGIQLKNEMQPGDWNRIIGVYGDACLKCGQKPVTQDHIVSLFEGGRHHPSNIQPLCLSCNSSKGAKCVDYRPHPFPA